MQQRIFLILFFLFSLCTPLSAQQEAPCDSLQHVRMERLDSLLGLEMFERSQVALYVYDLTADCPILMHNAQQTMRPASVQKVVTAVAALDALGCKYKYSTALYVSGTREGASLHGNLAIKAGFDPLFDHNDLRAFVRSISAEGISRISGNLLLDVSLKDTVSKGWGWCWDDDDKSLSPLCYADGGSFTKAFLAELRKANIRIEGGIRFSPLPEDARLLCRRTHSISAVLQDMMKESDNHHAESMFYQLAAQSGKPFATRKEAAAAINSLIERLGLQPENYRIADGSGLSLYNYISAELLGKILHYAYKRKSIFSTLMPSLPIAGVDGTLEKRMRETPAQEKIRAKTGSVSSVSTLAGYAEAPDGHLLCFVIFNQGLIKTKTGREFQDAVCIALTAP